MDKNIKLMHVYIIYHQTIYNKYLDIKIIEWISIKSLI